MVKNLNCGQKSQFWSKISILVKNLNFGQKSQTQNWQSTAKLKVVPDTLFLDPSQNIILSSQSAVSSCFVTGWGHTELNTGGTGYIKINRPVVLQQSLMKLMTEESCFNTQLGDH